MALVGLLVTACLLLSACGSSSSGTGSPQAAAPTSSATDSPTSGVDTSGTDGGSTTATLGSTTSEPTVSTPPTPTTASTVTTPTAPGSTVGSGTDPAPAGGLSPVKPGDSGAGVVALQKRLLELGLTSSDADGRYGSRTTSAVKGFQLVIGTEQTGEADAATIAALGAYRYDGTVLHPGDEGPAVTVLQQRLASGPFDPGPADGKYGPSTIAAVWALTKLAGVPVDSNWGPIDDKAWELVSSGAVGQPQKSHDQRWVEVDLSAQLMKVYEPGSTRPMLVSHISSGSGIPWANEGHSGSAITPKGSFKIYNRISGWRESSLDIGRLYNPLYFNGGIALHGALSVPLHPASHGCIRLPMHIADYLPSKLPNGTPVDVLA